MAGIDALMSGAIYRVQERLLRRPTFAYLRELERSQCQIAGASRTCSGLDRAAH